jgi:hypothetical protein
MKSIRFRIAVAALGVAVAAFSLASPASAFIRLTRAAASGSGVVQAHWYDSELPLVSVVNATNADLPYATEFAIVTASAKAWEDVNTSYFTVNPVDWTSGPYLPPALAFDGQNSLLFDVAGVNFATGSGVIAFVRSYVNLTDGHTVDADLVFNDKEFWQSTSSPVLTPSPDPNQTSIDVQAVITHEYGHYFSLDHTSIANATMIPFILNDTSQRTLELDDRAGLSTVYPESASRPGGVTPGGVDFGATTGTISGTCLNGADGSATFGAHVEAINVADPTPEASISAISGEMTLRDGQGDWMIHGLPPGTYAVRIVPLDGVHTIAADANIGGVFNGLDINFEPEFWNGAGEGACGYTDPPNAYSLVSVSPGANTGGLNFVTNIYPGRVNIAQYGVFENNVTYRNTGYRAVRFDPPFDPPYTIQKISFPTYTFDGLPATFVSVKLCEMLPNGLPNLAAPLVNIAPFAGSPNGVNDIPINMTVNDPGKTYFWVMQFPAAGGSFPYNFPFLRMDYTTMEQGLYGNTYDISLAGGASLLIDRNIAVDMTCQIGSMDCSLAGTAGVPIEAAQSLGANRRDTKTEFNFVRPTDTRADGFPMAANSLQQTDLLARPPFGPWTLIASGGAGTGAISLNNPPGGVVLWGAQAVDKNGHKAILTNTTITGYNEDADEPNGRLNEATALATPVISHNATYSPAGDQDYYSFMAKPGDMIEAFAVATGQDGANNLDLTMFLFDNSGNIVAFDDDSNGNLNPALTYTVPPASSNSKSMAPRTFTILMTDFGGSFFAPTRAPRVITPQTYQFSVGVTPSMLAGRLARGMNPDGFGFMLGGPNPANPHAKLVYVLPRNADGTRVALRLYDIQGRLVRTLVDQNEQAGPHTVVWDGTDQSGRSVSSGTYFARITAGPFRAQEKILFVK